MACAHIRMAGRLILDDGAIKAIVKNGKSLLPIGVVEVQGDFDEGDVVECMDAQGGACGGRSSKFFCQSCETNGGKTQSRNQRNSRR